MRKATIFSAAGSAALSFILCGLATAQAQKHTPLSSRTTILTGVAARSLLVQHSRPSPDKVSSYWTPTKQEVRAADAQLSAFLQKLPVNRLEPRTMNNDYHQYAGFVRGGRKFLYLNGFAPSMKHHLDFFTQPGKKSFDWKREPVVIYDGGSSYWGAEYDMQTRQWSHFHTNYAP